MSVQNPESSRQLPVHGFVLAGGKSSRMGADKVTALFRGRPMVEIAVEKLRTFCAEVSIAGNRDDLAGFAPVVQERRLNCGPGAGVEAGLIACKQPWALFVPVDVPSVPAELLRLWCDEALRVEMSVSYLGIIAKQPAFCLLRRERLAAFAEGMDGGERRLARLLNGCAETDQRALRVYDEQDLYGHSDYQGPDGPTLQRWFANVNTPEELGEAERQSKL